MKENSPYHRTNRSIAFLVNKLAEGDADAIAQIYQQTYQKLYYFGLQIAGSHEENLVEGIIQDLFIWLAKNYQQVAAIKNFEAYLYQSIRKNIKQQLQAQQEKEKAKSRYLRRTEPNKPRFVTSPETNFLQAEAKEADQATVAKALKQLPDYQKEVIYLRFYEDRSYKEIAEILSINGQVARNYVYRALTKLRKGMRHLPILVF